MKRFFTLLLTASCLTAVGQVTYPYNPDEDGNGHIAVGDLQGILATYGNEFSPSEILVNGEPLTTVLTELQGEIDHLFHGLAFGEKAFWDLDTLSWLSFDFPLMQFAAVKAETDGILQVEGTDVGYLPYRLSVVPEEDLPCEDLTQCDGMLIQAIFAAAAFRNYQYHDLWSGDNVPPLTIPVKKGEFVCLRKDGFSHAFLQRFIWTPLEEGSQSEGSNWTCGGQVSYQGHDYQTVAVGGRCWFAESLKYLPEVHEWSNQSSDEPRFYLRDYSGTSVEEAQNESGYDTVGVYYNWTATAMNFCPTGWGVPLLDDWLRLLPVFTPTLEPNLYGTGSYMIDENDWPEPDLSPHGKPYDLWQLKLKPNGRFTGDVSGEFWENIGTGFYQNIPPNGMLGIGAWDLNLDVFGSYGYSNTIRCIKNAE